MIPGAARSRKRVSAVADTCTDSRPRIRGDRQRPEEQGEGTESDHALLAENQQIHVVRRQQRFAGELSAGVLDVATG